MTETGDQHRLKTAVYDHRRLRDHVAYRMYLVAAPTTTSRTYAARLEHGRLLRDLAWRREGPEQRLTYSNRISLVDEHGEVVATKSW